MKISDIVLFMISVSIETRQRAARNSAMIYGELCRGSNIIEHIVEHLSGVKCAR